MKINNLLTTLVILLMGFTASAQNKGVDRIIKDGTTDNQVMSHLDVLTNRFGGRPIGSNAYDNSLQWVASKFSEWGLEVAIEEAGTLPVGFNRGPWFGRMLGGEREMILHFVTPSYTAGTKGVQKGHVLMEPKTQAEFDRMKSALNGAWVLISGKSKGWAISTSEEADSLRNAIIADNTELEKKNEEIQRKNWENGTNDTLFTLREEPALFYRQMCEAGVLGFIQSASVPLTALYSKDVVNDKTMTFDKLPTAPDIKLDEHQFDIIAQMVRERRTFELEFDIRNHFRMGPVKYCNVVGKIRGTKYPDEYVMLSGHLDSYDASTGGVDCGSGVSAVIEAARLISQCGVKPKRSMLFVAFAGEEFGLYGATAWVNAHRGQLAKISNLMNKDGGPMAASYISVTEAMMDDFTKICKPINDIRSDMPFEVRKREPRKRPTSAGGTDASEFAIEGIPTIGVGERDVFGTNFSYGEIWHTERDLYNKVPAEYEEHTALVMSIISYGIANLDHLLSRKGYYLDE